MRQGKRAVAQEFFKSVVVLGKLVRERYLDDVRKGLREPNFAELRELEENIKVCEREMEK